MSHMRKPVYAICEQQRRRSAFASTQSAHLHSLISAFVVCCLNNTILRLSKSKILRLASLCSRAGQFESYLVANPEDRFSHDMAQMMAKMIRSTQ